MHNEMIIRIEISSDHRCELCRELSNEFMFSWENDKTLYLTKIENKKFVAGHFQKGGGVMDLVGFIQESDIIDCYAFCHLVGKIENRDRELKKIIRNNFVGYMNPINPMSGRHGSALRGRVAVKEFYSHSVMRRGERIQNTGTTQEDS